MARPEILTKSFGPPALQATTSWSRLVVEGGCPLLPRVPTRGPNWRLRSWWGRARTARSPPLCRCSRRSACRRWISYFGAKSPRRAALEGRASPSALPPAHAPTHPEAGAVRTEAKAQACSDARTGRGLAGAAGRCRAVGELAAAPAPRRGPSRVLTSLVPRGPAARRPRPGLPP